MQILGYLYQILAPSGKEDGVGWEAFLLFSVVCFLPRTSLDATPH